MPWGTGVHLKGADGTAGGTGPTGPPGTPFPPVPARSSLAAYLNSGWVDTLAGGIQRIDAVTNLDTNFGAATLDIPFPCTLTGLVTAVECSFYVTPGADHIRLALQAPDTWQRDLLIGWDAGNNIGSGTAEASRVVAADDGPISSAHTGGAHTGRMHPDDGYCNWNNSDRSLNTQFGGRNAAGTWNLRCLNYFGSFNDGQVHAASLTVTTAADATHAASIYKWAERVWLEGLIRWAGALETNALITGTPLPTDYRPARESFIEVPVHPSSPAALRGFFAWLRVGVDGTISFLDGLYSAGGRPVGGSTQIPVGTVFSLDGRNWRAAP